LTYQYFQPFKSAFSQTTARVLNQNKNKDFRVALLAHMIK